MSAGALEEKYNNRAPASSGYSTGGMDQNEETEPDMDNSTYQGGVGRRTIEVVERLPDGRERRAVLPVPDETTADGARRMAVRLLEVAYRIERR
jgi:hypothetical protein